MKAAKTAVKQTPEKEVPAEVLATSIVTIADGMRKLRASRLTERALVALLQDATGLSQRNIKTVLVGLDDLERMYVKR